MMKKVKNSDLFRVFLRSFYIQGTWSVERMLGLGFCFCIIPIAKRLCSNKEEMIKFLDRHMEYFNSQPYMASYALGAIAKLEEQAIAKQWKDAKPITVFKERLISPLGAIGDSLFWKSWKPLASTIGIITSMAVGWTGALVFLILYNLLHLYFRMRGIFQSYHKGFDIIRDLSIRGTKKYFSILSSVISAAIGALVVSSVFWLRGSGHDLKEIMFFIMMVFVSFGLTFRRNQAVETSFIIIIIISVTIGLII